MDKLNGKGAEQLGDGSSYSGSYRNGLKHGRGELTFANGCVYEGEF